MFLPVDCTPDIAGTSVIVQIFDAHRFQQKMVLIQLTIAAEGLRHAAFDSLFIRHRKIELCFFNHDGFEILRFFL